MMVVLEVDCISKVTFSRPESANQMSLEREPAFQELEPEVLRMIPAVLEETSLKLLQEMAPVAAVLATELRVTALITGVEVVLLTANWQAAVSAQPTADPEAVRATVAVLASDRAGALQWIW
jgi:hypothetical protein